MEKIYLVLENGEVFDGKSFGAKKEVVGEVVYNTSMVGYLDILTDKTYYGQFVMQTFPLIGNYGVINEEVGDKKCYPTAYIAREICDEPSNFRCDGKLNDFLTANGVVGICDIDTRHLTKVLRDNGSMRAIITTTPILNQEQWNKLRTFSIDNALANTADKTLFASASGKYNVAVVDYGCDKSVREMLIAKDCKVTTFAFDATAEKILATKPNGIVLTSGAGDPNSCALQVEQIKKLLGANLPILAIGLGHQLLALANSGRVDKMKNGHRGANQPIRKIADGSLFVTSQNHGYVVDKTVLPLGGAITFENVNDNSCEGLSYRDGKITSVQFEPTKNGGYTTTEFVFDNFVENMEVTK
ncbi:MAG: carbamoyl phosphate synthase small subunit [Clostridia bacterium]